MPGHALTLPSDGNVQAERPEGTVTDTFTSALGLSCQKIVTGQGNVVACEKPSGWLVVEDYAQGQSTRP
ncbi:MAG: hypothetical protein AAFX52_14175 [Pseudomonadota bacterium]